MLTKGTILLGLLLIVSSSAQSCAERLEKLIQDIMQGKTPTDPEDLPVFLMTGKRINDLG